MKIWKNGQYQEIPNPTPAELAEMQAAQVAWESSPEYKAQQIAELKERLAATDYKALKFFEGWLTADEYESVKAERQAIRDKINALEASMK